LFAKKRIGSLSTNFGIQHAEQSIVQAGVRVADNLHLTPQLLCSHFTTHLLIRCPDVKPPRSYHNFEFSASQFTLYGIPPLRGNNTTEHSKCWSLQGTTCRFKSVLTRNLLQFLQTLFATARRACSTLYGYGPVSPSAAHLSDEVCTFFMKDVRPCGTISCPTPSCKTNCFNLLNETDLHAKGSGTLLY